MAYLTTVERRKIAGWVGTVERCRSCVSFKPCVFSQPPMIEGARGVRGQSALCTLNEFPTTSNSWCNDYKRKGLRVTASRDRKDIAMDNRRNTDQLDFAADLQDELNRRGVEMAREALREQPHPDFDGKHCIDCAEEINPKRLKALPFCARCVSCQEQKEKRR